MRCGNADGPPNVDAFRLPRGRRSSSRAFELDLEHVVCGHFAGHAVMIARHIGGTQTSNGSVSHE
jgi:hypothetical protein